MYRYRRRLNDAFLQYKLSSQSIGIVNVLQIGNEERGRENPWRADEFVQPQKEIVVTSHRHGLVISVMLAVEDMPTAVNWYKRALGATELWSHGSVAGMEIEGASFFLGEPAKNGWECPAKLGITSARVEVFCDDPDALIACALEAGAQGSLDTLQDHRRPWGTHRQGGFTDPFGHIWLVGDKSPLGPLA
jgi:PhnB protein